MRHSRSCSLFGASPLPGAAISIALFVFCPRPVAASTVVVQPIHVCNNAGANCGDAGNQLFTAATNTIWANAGVNVMFLPFTSVNNTALQVIDNAADLAALFGDASANSSATLISMWFVTLINDCGGGAAFGCANTPGNRIAIDDDTFTFNGWRGADRYYRT
jgi:hypothetical protein